MRATVRQRLQHMRAAIANARTTMAGKTFEALAAEPITRAAFERFIEILSEASRYVPRDMKEEHPQIPLRQIADIGNRLRHGYDRTDPAILWDIYRLELDDLDRVIEAMMADPRADDPA